MLFICQLGNVKGENFPRIFRKGEGNLVFCYTVSRNNYFWSVSQQTNSTNPKFQDWHI